MADMGADALESREDRDKRIQTAGFARRAIDAEKHPSTSLVNGKTVAYYAAWVVYLSERVDLLTDALEAAQPVGAGAGQTENTCGNGAEAA